MKSYFHRENVYIKMTHQDLSKILFIIFANFCSGYQVKPLENPKDCKIESKIVQRKKEKVLGFEKIQKRKFEKLHHNQF